MLGKYAGFVGEVWQDFPQLAEWHDDDPSLLSMWSLDKFIEAGYHNFHAERKQLFHISKLIENYAKIMVSHYLPLLKKLHDTNLLKKDIRK